MWALSFTMKIFLFGFYCKKIFKEKYLKNTYSHINSSKIIHTQNTQIPE